MEVELQGHGRYVVSDLLNPTEKALKSAKRKVRLAPPVLYIAAAMIVLGSVITFVDLLAGSVNVNISGSVSILVLFTLLGDSGLRRNRQWIEVIEKVLVHENITVDEISKSTGIEKSVVDTILKNAIERGKLLGVLEDDTFTPQPWPQSMVDS